MRKTLLALCVSSLIVGLVVGQTYNNENRTNDISAALLAGMGADLSSAGTITPTNLIHRVTGITTVTTITPPVGIQSGQILIIIPKGLFVTLATGNIAIATTCVVDRALVLVWDATDSKWKPSY